MIGTTITQFLIEEQRNIHGATGDLTSVINDVVTACKAISSAMRYGALSDDDLLGVSSSENVQGETQQTLDIVANDLFLRRTEFGGHVAAMVSEEMEDVYEPPARYSKGRYLLLYDPVDGSSNIAENAAIGTIFSILKRPDNASETPQLEEFLQPGSQQVCAGYAIYGSSTMVVMTTGNGVNGFTLDPLIGEFVLSQADMRIPNDGVRLYANFLHSPHWDQPEKDYLADCQAGRDGPRGHDFDPRWSAGAVADVHRLFFSGGIYLYPGNARFREQGLVAKLRLLYEVSPLAFLVEQAGGIASDGEQRVLDIEPKSLHQRSPAVFGSKVEVEYFLKVTSKRAN